MHENELREEFVSQVNYLRKKVFKKVKAKQLKGSVITGQMLVELAETYIEALNKGGIPVIETAWEYIQSNDIEAAFKESINLHEKLLTTSLLPNLPFNDKKLKSGLKEVKEESLNKFRSTTVGNINNSKNLKYIGKLKLEMHDQRDIIVKKNKELC